MNFIVVHEIVSGAPVAMCVEAIGYILPRVDAVGCYIFITDGNSGSIATIESFEELLALLRLADQDVIERVTGDDDAAPAATDAH